MKIKITGLPNNYIPQKLHEILSRSLMSQSGFTLVELLVVFVVIGILSSISIAGYVSYDRVQQMNAATYDVVQFFQVAKSRSVSQVKPTFCTGINQPFNGFRVRISNGNTDGDQLYSMIPVCGGNPYTSQAVMVKQLPTSYHFESAASPGNSTYEFNFDAQKGQVSYIGGGTGEFHIKIDGTAPTPHRSIFVDRFGNVRVTDP